MWCLAEDGQYTDHDKVLLPVYISRAPLKFQFLLETDEEEARPEERKEEVESQEDIFEFLMETEEEEARPEQRKEERESEEDMFADCD